MKVIDYFNRIEECSEMETDEGFHAFDKCVNNLSKQELLELIIEFTSIVARLDVSLDILENPFDTDNDWDKVSEEDKIAYKKESKLMNKSHLKIVH